MLRAAPHFGMEPAALRMLVEAPPAAGSGDVAAPAPGCCESEPMVLVWGGGVGLDKSNKASPSRFLTAAGGFEILVSTWTCLPDPCISVWASAWQEKLPK